MKNKRLRLIQLLAFIGLTALFISFQNFARSGAGESYYNPKVFNYDFYIQKYPELSSLSKNEAKSHWLQFGIQQGKQASAEFSVEDYKQSHPDKVIGLDNFEVIEQFVKTE